MLSGSEILQLLVVKRWGEARGGRGRKREVRLGRRDWLDWMPVPTGDGPGSGRRCWVWRRLRQAPKGAPFQRGSPKQPWQHS